MNQKKVAFVLLILGLILIIAGLIIGNKEKEIFQINEDTLTKMSGSKLSSLYESIDYASLGFVDKKILKYENIKVIDEMEKTASSMDDANQLVKDAYKTYLRDYEIVSTKNLKGQNMYYPIYVSEKSRDGKVANHTYLILQSDLINIEDQNINMSKINSKKKLKSLLNLTNYILNCNTKNYKLVTSYITENAKEYVYILYYFSSPSTISNNNTLLNKEETFIDKKTGDYVINKSETIKMIKNKN